MKSQPISACVCKAKIRNLGIRVWAGRSAPPPAHTGLICVNTFKHKEHTNSGFVADLFAEFSFLLWLLQICLKQPLLSLNALKQRTHALSNFPHFSLFCFFLIICSSAFSLIAFPIYFYVLRKIYIHILSIFSLLYKSMTLLKYGYIIN